MKVKDLNIVIIGGGPAGLSMARLLQLNDFKNVMVVERDINRTIRVGGSSLDLHSDSGLIFIEKAKLMNEFLRVSRPEGESITIADKNANIVLKKPHLKIASKKPEIDRGVLRDLLVDSLVEGTIKWDHQFVSLNQLDNGKTEIVFKDGKTIVADLVIGADGANSKIRPYVTDMKLKYSGITLVEFEVENPKQLCPQVYEWVDAGLFYVLDDEKGFIVQLKGDGNLIIYLSCKREENWIKNSGLDFKNDLESVKTFIKKEVLSDWNPIFHNVVDNATFFIPRPLFSIPLDPMIDWKSNKNITLIGDAAHTIVPYAGKGINSGMMDAVELTECLIEPSDMQLSERLNRYEEKMHTRMLEVATDSMDAQEIVHNKDANTLLVDRFLGYYKYVKDILPYFIYSINYITDLFGFSK
ncbi:hypothetical protein DICPUDRAFT_150613 [Dictyostelium purpureum]|uniref:FAD-binding domain-containing protein n=1 Tax=Dictyostelium purpureum TaxID=5786 RepID=F0ZGS7_DICPU|nr:uncharacterized protein DICPUDRAFT_150613 [Dictyostelium purpureum]EGC36823.1 hypothetical protein DICPUDRAFT_150613 [Dictyostelium purpureum]|eukprot:XP_003286621.1 hypothetical protein DICPUDRAFT_150613 [Dictyostelium purpureum]